MERGKRWIKLLSGAILIIVIIILGVSYGMRNKDNNYKSTYPKSDNAWQKVNNKDTIAKAIEEKNKDKSISTSIEKTTIRQ